MAVEPDGGELSYEGIGAALYQEVGFFAFDPDRFHFQESHVLVQLFPQ